MSDDTSEDATSEETEQVDESEETETQAEDSLGDAGKKALDAMKQQRNAAKAEARQVKAELDRLRAEAANRDKPAEEQAIEKARAEARAEATEKANKRVLRSELKALATGKLADPTDAALFINLDDFTVDDNGDVDSDALNDAITELLEKKPHLAARKQNRFDGGADQGAKGKDAKPAQLTQSDLDRMTPEQIETAHNAGQLDKLLGIIQ